MTIGGYDAFDDPYSYRGTDVLKNRLGTRDPEILQAFELEMSALRADEPLPTGRYGPAHYRAIHRHLFQDIYSWADRAHSERRKLVLLSRAHRSSDDSAFQKTRRRALQARC